MFIIPQQLDRQLKDIYNKSQYEAITSSLKQEGVTLIQGPPGTGKTKTVLGTISVLLQSSTSKEED
jgi:senataxin